MAVTGNEHGFFWDSNNGDRTYNSESFELWLKKFFTSGVFQDELQVTAGGGMSVAVSAGYANCDGKVKMFGSDNLSLDAASSTLPRIDTVVVERNDSDRTFYLKVVKGAYNGQSPVATAPVRTGGVYQLVLAQIRVNAGATSISTGNITDKRPDSAVCGWVTGTVDEIDLQQILAQSEAEFGEWFDAMKGQLSTDAAGNLQLQIDNILDEDSSISDSNLWQHLQECVLSSQFYSVTDNLASAKVNKRVLSATATGSTTDVVYFHASQYVNMIEGEDTLVTFANVVNANYMVMGVVGFGCAHAAVMEVSYILDAPRTFRMRLYGTETGQASAQITVAAIHKNWLNS